MRFTLYGVTAIATLFASVIAQVDKTALVNSTTSASSIDANDPKTLTTWTYNPIWPDITTKQRALAPIATSRQQAVDIVRRAFPTLRDVLENKIDFAISPRKDMYGGPLISILDDAWAGMATWPPETMLVSVKEFPEDKARRLKHEKGWTMPWKTIGWIVLGCAVIALLAALPKNQPSYTAVQNSDIEQGPQATTQDDTVRSTITKIERSEVGLAVRCLTPPNGIDGGGYEMPRMYNCADDTPSGSANIGEANRDRMRRRYGRDCAIV